MATTKTEKLMVMAGDSFTAPELATEQLSILLQQDGCLGGGVEAYQVRTGFGEYHTEHLAHVFFAVPMACVPPHGCGIVGRKFAKPFGIKIPRHVDA